MSRPILKTNTTSSETLLNSNNNNNDNSVAMQQSTNTPHATTHGGLYQSAIDVPHDDVHSKGVDAKPEQDVARNTIPAAEALGSPGRAGPPKLEKYAYSCDLLYLCCPSPVLICRAV
jgi:hypothetical protein